MLGECFRPWGSLHWVLDRIPKVKKWNMLGCLSPEDRCIATLSELENKKLCQHATFFEVIDPSEKSNPSSDDTIRSQGKREKRKQDLNNLLNPSEIPSETKTFSLMARDQILVDATKDFITNSSGDMVVDISSFPKRFFFPIIKLLLKSKKIKNLIITYTVPESYTSQELAEDHLGWHHLPLFLQDGRPEQKAEVAFVGVGFLPLDLPELLKNELKMESIFLLFPFPPGPPNYQRTWNFVRKIEKSTHLDQEQIVRIDALDVSAAFNAILAKTDSGSKRAIFAPYGPKPISLAMCIYASLSESPVYYTQPQTYHPDYSTGIKKVDGLSEIYAYCLRINGKEFYTKASNEATTPNL